MASYSKCQILWATQTGRAKACARRTARILREQTTVEVLGAIGSAFDEASEPFLDLVTHIGGVDNGTFLLIFVSTTGDGEQCDSIRETWKALLQKSLPPTLLEGKQFAMFCLGDRAYGPLFCAAGRKLAVRLMQLGMKRTCEVGYGDDNTPDGGVFADLDDWLENQLLPVLESQEQAADELLVEKRALPYEVTVGDEVTKDPSGPTQEWQEPAFQIAYRDYFSQSCPITAYSYVKGGKRLVEPANERTAPLLGSVTSNNRITAPDWDQDTRHIQMQLESTVAASDDSKDTATLPYQAGDIASILPFNSDGLVDRFLSVLPERISVLADRVVEIAIDESKMNNSYVRWPAKCTLRGLLKFCADIHALPEREDLRALSPYCSQADEIGKNQSDKLKSLSETSEAALYADYVLREKRSWSDVIFDFESLRADGSNLTLESLLLLLPQIRPRDFSIASAPSWRKQLDQIGERCGFPLELCVAIVKGRTRLGRSYHGLCSEFLSRMVPKADSPPPLLQVWIRPGSFGRLPLELDESKGFTTPVMCVGAGTGVAPMRSILLEREAVRSLSFQDAPDNGESDENNNILVFGCRKQQSDFYYREEWDPMVKSRQMRLLTAFSRDQFQKLYVQKVLREADGGNLIATHVLERDGAIYIAGNPKMARAVKEEIVEALGKVLTGGEKQANQLLNKLQRLGKFSIEAWG